jgi:hypothetical protein
MNYYKGLEIIGKTGDFDKIPTELLHDYINDFTLEFNSRSLVKKLNIAVVGSVCDECTDGSGWYGCEDITYNCSKCNPEAN